MPEQRSQSDKGNSTTRRTICCCSRNCRPFAVPFGGPENVLIPIATSGRIVPRLLGLNYTQEVELVTGTRLLSSSCFQPLLLALTLEATGVDNGCCGVARRSTRRRKPTKSELLLRGSGRHGSREPDGASPDRATAGKSKSGRTGRSVICFAQDTKEPGSKVVGRLPRSEAGRNCALTGRLVPAQGAGKVAAQGANADGGQRVGGIFEPGQCGQEGAQDGGDSDEGPAGEGEVFRDKSEEHGHLLLQGLCSKDAENRRNGFSMNEPEQYISALLREIFTLMQQKTAENFGFVYSVVTAVSWLKALIHSHTSQLMMLGSENLLANFGTCLGIIEYRVQHANSLSK
ncbi:conserved hypothetical protein [Culex quinquefasciatus]|uniref:Uncharacterized protein n=1 Tax=Culex quinquefasciatus TaxID=7176 RepID=B0XAH5_CULQU|nr:conserved hypothetical protein [Culex quinquefasciatus]|eukprot:XP_001866647.1 conserved hypothetical protein [Culex quinquefasciatus]